MRNKLRIPNLVTIGLFLIVAGCSKKKHSESVAPERMTKSKVIQASKPPAPKVVSATPKTELAKQAEPSKVKSKAAAPAVVPQKARTKVAIAEKTATPGSIKSTQLLGTWSCVTEQPVMRLSVKETYGEDLSLKSEGTIEFRVPEGPSLNIFVESESRWSLRGDTLCDVPRKMDLTQTSGEENVHIDNLLKSMREQVKARIEGNLATCRTIVSVSASTMQLQVPQKSVETRCIREEG